MKKIIILLLLSFNATAAMNIFYPKSPVLANQMNQNFNYLNTLLITKNIQINFNQYNQAELITKDSLNQNLNLLASIGITIPSINGEYIKSEELNGLFQSLITNISAYNNI